MSQLKRYYGENDLHFLTTSTYGRARVFDSERFKLEFVAKLAKLRSELGFRLPGYVLMPEHCRVALRGCPSLTNYAEASRPHGPVAAENAAA